MSNVDKFVKEEKKIFLLIKFKTSLRKICLF